MYDASRSGDMWKLKGKADSTGGILVMHINVSNGKGTIKYYAPNGTEFGNGKAQCLRKK